MLKYKMIDTDGLFLFFSTYIVYKVFNMVFKDLKELDTKKLVGHVSKLTLYPVKSMKDVYTLQLDCKDDGAYIDQFGDRMFMVVYGNEYKAVTSRQEPKIVLIQPSINKNSLTLSCQRMDNISMDIDVVIQQNVEIKSSLHGGEFSGLDCGDEVGAWIDKYLGREGHRLLYSAPTTLRRHAKTCNPKYNKWNGAVPEDSLLAFQGAASYHLMSESTLDDLNSRLINPVGPHNFRPNILVSGCPPYNEDTWSKIFINDVEFTSLKLCNRCLSTSVNFTTGERETHFELVKCLKGYRKIVDELITPVLGIHMFLAKEGSVRVGDPVYAVVSQPRLKP